MLVDGQEFDMGEAEIADVSRQLLRKLAIAEPLVAVLAPPRAEMDLVDRHRRTERIDIGRRGPRMRQLGLVEHDGGRAWGDPGGKGHWNGFQEGASRHAGRQYRTCSDRRRWRGART